MTYASGESFLPAEIAECALGKADIGYIDIPVDHPADIIARHMGLPQLVTDEYKLLERGFMI